MPVELSFEYFLNLILIARNVYSEFKMSNSTNTFKVDYTNYVTSQLHLNVISSLYEKTSRSIYEYFNAYKYLHKEGGSREDALKVLLYFLDDVQDFFLHARDTYYLTIDCNESELGIQLPIVDEELVKEETMQFIKVITREQADPEKFDNVFRNTKDISTEEAYKITSRLPYSKMQAELITTCTSADDMIDRIENLVQVAICGVRLIHVKEALKGVLR